MTAWAEPGLVHRCNDGHKEYRAGAPLGEPALWFFMRRERSRKKTSHGRSASDDLRLLLPEDRILGSFGHAELDHTLGWDLDGLTGLWVPPHASLAVRQYELPDPRYHEDILRFLVSQGG